MFYSKANVINKTNIDDYTANFEDFSRFIFGRVMLGGSFLKKSRVCKPRSCPVRMQSRHKIGGCPCFHGTWFLSFLYRVFLPLPS